MRLWDSIQIEPQRNSSNPKTSHLSKFAYVAHTVQVRCTVCATHTARPVNANFTPSTCTNCPMSFMGQSDWKLQLFQGRRKTKNTMGERCKGLICIRPTDCRPIHYAPLWCTPIAYTYLDVHQQLAAWQFVDHLFVSMVNCCSCSTVISWTVSQPDTITRPSF